MNLDTEFGHIIDEYLKFTGYELIIGTGEFETIFIIARKNGDITSDILLTKINITERVIAMDSNAVLTRIIDCVKEFASDYRKVKRHFMMKSILNCDITGGKNV